MSGSKRREGGPDADRFKQFLCKVCENDIGVATSSAVEHYFHIIVNVKTGRVDKRSAGKEMICAHCLARGKITPVK